MTSCNLNYLLKKDPIDKFSHQILDIRASKYEFGGDGATNLQSIVVVLLDATNSTSQVVLTQCRILDYLHIESLRSK